MEIFLASAMTWKPPNGGPVWWNRCHTAFSRLDSAGRIFDPRGGGRDSGRRDACPPGGLLSPLLPRERGLHRLIGEAPHTGIGRGFQAGGALTLSAVPPRARPLGSPRRPFRGPSAPNTSSSRADRPCHVRQRS